MSSGLKTYMLAALAIAMTGCPPKASGPGASTGPSIPSAPAAAAGAKGIYFVALDVTAAPVPPGGIPPTLQSLAAQIVAQTQGKLVEVSDQGFIGAVVEMTPAAAAALDHQHLTFVRYIEANQPVHSDSSCAQPAECASVLPQSPPIIPWGRVRIRHRCPRIHVEVPPCRYEGEGAHVYVIDSGIDRAHPDFRKGLFGQGFTLIGGSEYDDDTGHGTAMAGIVAGRMGGVAQRVTLHSCRFMGLDGSGVPAGDVHGARDAIKKVRLTHEPRSVALMAFSTRKHSQVLDDEVNALVAADVAAVASAGNYPWVVSGVQPSPASATSCLAVGAIDWDDRVWSNTVLGTQVKVFAPGAGILAPVAGEDGTGTAPAYWSGSGTSQAAAHVAGMVARARALMSPSTNALMAEGFVTSMASVDLLRPTEIGLAANRLAFDCPCVLPDH